MLEAKDTVMSEEQLGVFWRNPSECNDVGIAQTQAEISFKAGQESVCTVAVTDIYDKGEQAGTRKVVEWFSSVGLDMKDWTEPEVWQAKLKEWNID